MSELVERVASGQIRAIARAISKIENEGQQKEELIDELFKHTGQAKIIGITGPPGSGKSSLLDRIIELETQKGQKVAVLAIDPSSPFTGGAILGDRVRMQKHATNPRVFIRSMASRGHLGGIAGATADAIKVLDAAGYDLIFIETIGVGQTEIDIMNIVDLVLLVLVPGLGDEIQALKAGVMEIGDIFVINKCDKDEAKRVKAEVEYVLHLKSEDHAEEMNPIFLTSATQNIGLEELVTGMEQELQKMEQKGQLKERRLRRLELELKHILTSKIEAHVHQFLNTQNHLQEWLKKLSAKQATPYQLVNQKVAEVLKEIHEK